MPRLSEPSHDAIDALEAVLAEQQDVTAAMASLIEQQESLVASGNAEGLLTLLGRRQELVDRLIASQDRLGEALSAAERALPSAGRERKDRIQAALASIQARLDEVMARDREDQAKLEDGRRKTKRELERMDVMHKAHTAYGRGAGRSNRYADHRG